MSAGLPGVAQNLAITGEVDGNFVVGVDGGTLMSLTAEWLDGEAVRSLFEGLGKGERGNGWGRDLAGNVAMATASDFIEGDFTLDTSADLEEVHGLRGGWRWSRPHESTDVSLSLSGIDADASSVSVEITDGWTQSLLTRASQGGRWSPTRTEWFPRTAPNRDSFRDRRGRWQRRRCGADADTVADLGGDLNGVLSMASTRS